MANLIFKYSAMNGGKTLNILQTAHSYEETNKKFIIIKSKEDTKGENKIVSRVGLERNVDILLEVGDSLLKEKHYKKYYNSSVILVDEVQFLSSENIEELWTIAHLINIPVIAYGLKSNFKGEIFSEGISKLFASADIIEEIGSSSLCNKCGKKSVFNARSVNKKFTDEGDTIVIDGDKSEVDYIPLCSDCYLKYVKIGSKKTVKLSKLVETIK